MKKFSLILLLFILFPLKVFANPACAVCTVAMGAFLGISRSLGISDNAAGVWIGSLILMSYFFAIKFMEFKNWKFKFYKLFCFILTIAIVPFIYKFIPYKSKIWFGIDAFLVSMIVGASVFWFSQYFYQILKRKNGGHAHFPFEKVVIAVLFLFITSFLFEYCL